MCVTLLFINRITDVPFVQLFGIITVHKGCDIMINNLDKQAKKYNGLFTYSELLKSYNKPTIRRLIEKNLILRVARGVYYHKDYTVDMMLVHQTLNKTIIYSHETAAYLHGLTDRFPRKYSISVKQGTNLRNRENFNIYYLNENTFNLGITRVNNNLNNEVSAYDKERTVCDMIRSKDRVELQVYTEVIQNYFSNKPNMNKLIEYAKLFNIQDKVYEISLLMLEG